jgi:hypothetical protein
MFLTADFGLGNDEQKDVSASKSAVLSPPVPNGTFGRVYYFLCTSKESRSSASLPAGLAPLIAFANAYS